MEKSLMRLFNIFRTPLSSVQRELRRSIDLAFKLANARNQTITLSPSKKRRQGQLNVELPNLVRWGKPEHIPLPESLKGSAWAKAKPRAITVTPQRTATANVWFLNDGRGALCLRLSIQGQVELMRYNRLLRRWKSLA
jgi:hypothetical protein